MDRSSGRREEIGHDEPDKKVSECAQRAQKKGNGENNGPWLGLDGEKNILPCSDVILIGFWARLFLTHKREAK